MGDQNPDTVIEVDYENEKVKLTDGKGLAKEFSYMGGKFVEVGPKTGQTSWFSQNEVISKIKNSIINMATPNGFTNPIRYITQLAVKYGHEFVSKMFVLAEWLTKAMSSPGYSKALMIFERDIERLRLEEPGRMRGFIQIVWDIKEVVYTGCKLLEPVASRAGAPSFTLPKEILEEAWKQFGGEII